MKLFIILLIVIFSAVSYCIAVKDSTNYCKNELGLNVFRWSNLNLNNIDYKFSYLNGLSYKRNYRLMSIRLACNYNIMIIH